MSRWTKDEMLAEFEVLGFELGLCVVRRRSDGVLGSLEFTNDPPNPRIYYGFQPHSMV